MGRRNLGREVVEIDMGTYLLGTTIEVINHQLKRGAIRYVLFDFDGTISLIRSGWENIMTQLIAEKLLNTPKGYELGEQVVFSIAKMFVRKSAGVQTIFQMKWLSNKVVEFGGKFVSPWIYKQLYNERLLKYIAIRIEALRNKQISPDNFLVPGIREFLERLRILGVQCYLASGTDRNHVLDEVALLEIEKYFSEIYGAQGWKNVKKVAVRQIMRKHSPRCGEFATFGDGFVEICETKRVGGIAVGVAFDEIGSGSLDQWKRKRLILAGADLIIPDYRDSEKLVEYLILGKT